MVAQKNNGFEASRAAKWLVPKVQQDPAGYVATACCHHADTHSGLPHAVNVAASLRALSYSMVCSPWVTEKRDSNRWASAPPAVSQYCQATSTIAFHSDPLRLAIRAIGSCQHLLTPNAEPLSRRLPSRLAVASDVLKPLTKLHANLLWRTVMVGGREGPAGSSPPSEMSLMMVIIAVCIMFCSAALVCDAASLRGWEPAMPSAASRTTICLGNERPETYTEQ
eukprot:497179-Pelagomonas_calceolata.AAC.2